MDSCIKFAGSIHCASDPNNGLWTREALGLKASDVRLVAGTAKSVRVSGRATRSDWCPSQGPLARCLGSG